MFIPQTNFCPASILKRNIGDDVTSTAKAFRSWDTCMDNKTCKIVAIVGIVLAVLVAFWIISTLIRCMCLGFTCLQALCCCCCRSASKDYHEKQNPYENPHMYAPPQQPVYQQQPQQYDRSYNPDRTSQPSVYDNNSYRYEPVGYQVMESRDPFNERQTAYNGR